MARSAGLDVPRIVAASFAIADADGLDGLTMRRLAVELGVTPMAVYHHVANKEQLLDLLVDESLRTLPEIDQDAPPECAVRAFFLAFHRLLVARPPLAHTLSDRPLDGSVAARIGEQVLVVLGRAGLDDDAAVGLLLSLFALTLGAALYRASRTAHPSRGIRGVSSDATPTAHRLRRRLVQSAAADAHFLRALEVLVTGYLAGAAPG